MEGGAGLVCRESGPVSSMLLALSLAISDTTVLAREREASVSRSGDVVILSTGLVKRHFRLTASGPVTIAIRDQKNDRDCIAGSDSPDITVPSSGGLTAMPKTHVQTLPATLRLPARIVVTFTFAQDSLAIRRECTLVSGSPAISCRTGLKGTLPSNAWQGVSDTLDLIEDSDIRDTGKPVFITDAFTPVGNHWRTAIIRFKTATDHNDTLVQRDQALLYRQPMRMEGNILSLSSIDGSGCNLFALKASPPGNHQLGWQGHDFTASLGRIEVMGSGFLPGDITSNYWTYADPVTIGLGGANESMLRSNVRTHLETTRRYVPEADSVLMSNSWGDRSRDARMTESFMRDEIEAAARLGLTVVQLDDGWQKGLSKNSASKAGARWEDWSADDWQPHPERFPNGLGSLVSLAETKGVDLGLWFNPSQKDNYTAWRRDADIIIDYWRKYGIRYVKIDGIEVPSEKAMRNLNAFFEHVETETGGAIVFNLDVTAGRRPGYFALNRHGNIFLENRYTDWGNYYPHRTLRNLWMLSAWVPPQWLQIEFLNVERNRDNYGLRDPLAPANVGQLGSFATTMVAQPLAWMELSNLPENNDDLQRMITAYRTVQQTLHAQRIFPIGNEPDGQSWTGFQSVDPEDSGSGFLLVYREPLAPTAGNLETLFTEGKRPCLKSVPGLGAQFSLRPEIGEAGTLSLALPLDQPFAIFEYQTDCASGGAP